MAVAGVSYRQDVVADCWEGDEVRLIRDPANKYDKNAIKVHSSMGHIGFIPREETEGLAPFIDGGGKAEAYIAELTGGTRDKPIISVILQVTLTPECHGA